VHGIGIVLVRDWAILTQTRMLGRYYAFLHDTPMVRSGAVIMHMVDCKTSATDFPQGAIVLIVVRQILIALEAVWKRGGRSRSLTFLAREEAKSSLRNCPTFKAVVTIFVNPF
jgi:hypothetical protein